GHVVGWRLQKQKADRVSAGHQESSKRLLQRVPEAAVTDAATVDKEVLEPGVTAVARGVGDEARQRYRAHFARHLDQCVADVLAEEEADAFDQARIRWDLVHQPAVVT